MTADEQAAIGQALRSIGDAVVYWRTMAERLERERNEAFAEVKQLQAERDAAQEELTRERERNAPLRARIKEIQEQADGDTRAMRKRLAYFDDLWQRAREELAQEVSPGCVALPSSWERAKFAVLYEERDAARVAAEELRAAGNAMAEWLTTYHGVIQSNAWRNGNDTEIEHIDAALDAWRALVAPAAGEGRRGNREAS